MALDYADRINMGQRLKLGGIDYFDGKIARHGQAAWLFKGDDVERSWDRPQEVVEDQERFEETRLDKPENQYGWRTHTANKTPTTADLINVATNMCHSRPNALPNEWLFLTKFVPPKLGSADAMAD